MKRYSILTVAILFTLYLTSCKEEPDSPDNEERLSIESLRATTGVDLLNRQDWILQVSSSEYTYTIDGQEILAQPLDHPAYFTKSYPVEAEIISINFYHPNYWREDSRSLGPTPPNIADQSTPDKLLAADRLFCEYSGMVTKEVRDVELIHSNALVEFDIIDLPSGAEVLVHSYVTITPYNRGRNYRAIVMAEEGEFDAQISITAGETNHTFSLINHMDNRYIKPNTHYQFVIRYDKENKTYSLENLRQSVWSEAVTMRLFAKKVADFKIFTGSPDRPVEVSTEGLDPSLYWKDRMIYYPEMIVLNDKETATTFDQDLDSETFTYKFEGNSMYRYNPVIERWSLSAIQEWHLLHYNIGYFRAGFTDPEMNWYHSTITHGNDIASEKGLSTGGYSLDLLKQETDTIMWCNMTYTYREIVEYIGNN